MQSVFNGLGQLVTEYQSHSGAVNTGTTPKVQYAYSEMASGANHSRLLSMTYPNGRVISYNYAAGLDSAISRLTSLSDTSATLESLKYLGLSTVVERAHPQPGIDLSFIKLAAEAVGDAGDQYTGLDRFYRDVDHRWRKTSDGSAVDRFFSGYDRDSNRSYKENALNAAFSELYHANGASNGYDPLNQLTAFSRGTLNGAKDSIASPSRSQSWALDALGNFNSQTTDGVAQTRGHNKKNRITSITGATTPTYDNNGNLTRDETGKYYKYDAWNRLVQVKASDNTTVLVTYAYDNLGRRVSENPGTVRHLYYSANWQIVEERIGSASTANIQYVWSPIYIDALILRDRDTNADGTLDERLYVLQDQNWNVTALVDTSGNVVERYVYDPYGLRTILTAAWGARASSFYAWLHGHQGGKQDQWSGWIEFRDRWLLTALGRWNKEDRLGFVDGSNLYVYVGNNPQNNLDPLGLQATEVGIATTASWLEFTTPVVGWTALLASLAFAGGYLTGNALGPLVFPDVPWENIIDKANLANSAKQNPLANAMYGPQSCVQLLKPEVKLDLAAFASLLKPDIGLEFKIDLKPPIDAKKDDKHKYCDMLFDIDNKTCDRVYKTPQDRTLCYGRAMERYGACLADRNIFPPLII